MLQDIIANIVGIIGLVINFVTMMLIFPTKRSLRFTVCALALSIPAFHAIVLLFGVIVPRESFLSGLIFVPIMMSLFQGKVFQKVFAIFFLFFAVILRASLARLVGGVFSGDGGGIGFAVDNVSLLMMHAIYIYWMLRYGHRIFTRLFVSGSSAEWAVYSAGAVFSFSVLSITEIAPGSIWQTGSLLIFIGWSFGVLCYAIINTHEKARQKFEADISREIVSSGRGYYDKLAEMTEQLHILRHDYKLHLTTMQKLLDNDLGADAREYLLKLNEKTSDTILRVYCDNRILNALLDTFAERCEKENISFKVKIILPPAEVTDYELCVILGNLLENAIAACLRTPEGRRRYIELSMRPREDNFGIKVENSYDGILKHEGKELFSTKRDGGMGISSIKSVSSRHNGEYVPVWDDEKFGAFVVLKLSTPRGQHPTKASEVEIEASKKCQSLQRTDI